MRQRREKRNNAQREEARSPTNEEQQIQHREYARNYMRQRREQMTNAEREEERNHRNQLDMAFPTLFPNGRWDWIEPRLRRVYLHEFVKHLLRYRDHCFG